MPFILKFLFISFLTLASHQTSDPIISLRGLRVDIGYLYDMYPGVEFSEVSRIVVSKAAASGINTLFVYAYNSVYGASYVTDYPHTQVEAGFGRLNILSFLSLEAKKYGIKVVACVPVNNFKMLWEQKPGWRVKDINGEDYRPAENMFLLSASHPEFKAWLFGFYKDLIYSNPYIEGVEIVEPFVDYRWQKEADYNPIANAKFKKTFPSGTLGDENWLNFRAQALTDLIVLMNTAAHLYSKFSYLIHTWPVQSNGRLFSSQSIKENIGLDIDALLQLKGVKSLDYLSAELMWQQWAAEFGSDLFNPQWTQQAAIEFLSKMNTKTIPLLHVEVTAFKGPKANVVTPTPKEFSDTLISIRNLNVGIDVYDYSQIEVAGLWKQLRAWF